MAEDSTTLAPPPAGAPGAPAPHEGAAVHLNPKQLAFFNRQLASMARLNMPLAKGLKIMAREVTEPGFRKLIESVQHDLEEGKTLQEALARYPESFGVIYIELLKAGETTGNLAVILEELTRYNDMLARIKTKLRDAILYPTVVMFLTVAFVLFFFLFLIPNFNDIFVQAGMIIEDPITHKHIGYSDKFTGAGRWLFMISDTLRNPFVLGLGFLGATVGGYFGLRRLMQGWENFDDFMFNIPLFGELIRMATLLKVTRTMRDLLVNGVSMVNALKLTSRVAGNNRVKRKLEEIRAAVEEGKSFSKSLGGDEVFPETMVWRLQMGEEKGIVEEALGEVAMEFELDIDTHVNYLTSVISPGMLLGMAFILMMLMGALYPTLGTLGKM